MLFKKSLEEFYREELFKTVSNCPDYQEDSPLDADRYITMSLLQQLFDVVNSDLPFRQHLRF